MDISRTVWEQLGRVLVAADNVLEATDLTTVTEGSTVTTATISIPKDPKELLGMLLDLKKELDAWKAIPPGPTYWEPLPKTAAEGVVFPIDLFLKDCQRGNFRDEDGSGAYAVTDKMSHDMFSPSDLMNGTNVPVWATHVVWFNR